MAESDMMERYKTFITAWLESRTIQEVCEKTGIDRRGCSNLASRIRQRGIPLPKRCSGIQTPRTPELLEGEWDDLRMWANKLIGQMEAERYRLA